MATHKHIDRICGIILAITLLLTIFFFNGEAFGIQPSTTVLGYEARLFDTSTVHSIDIVMNDWDNFIETCTNEEYSSCTVIIDNEAYKNVAIRAKGNTSLTQTQSYGNDRYSFKIEFDHYDNTKSYYGLDKLCLNNIIQDNTYIKDYLVYQMMREFNVASPLCSFVYITVNGNDWGLYLAVEGIEESFLQRNYGNDYGALYKPDSQSMGGGRGQGKDFSMDSFMNHFNEENASENMESVENLEAARENQPARQPEAQNDVSLIYSDDSYDSYANIFDNAKTKLSDSDKDRLIASLKQINEMENLEDAVDIEAVIRYFVVHNFVLNFDSYTGSMIHNYYLYEKDGRLSMIPWDYNLAFGGFDNSSDATALINYPIDSPISGGTIEARPMLAWIFSSEDYTTLYHQYFSTFVSVFFDSGYFTEMITSVRELISPYVKEDPTKFCTYEEFETGIETLEKFCLLRADSITNQLNGTIGSDFEAQNADTLITGDDISIAAMGSMNASMGQFMPKSDTFVPDDPPDNRMPSPFLEENGNDGNTDNQGRQNNQNMNGNPNDKPQDMPDNNQRPNDRQVQNNTSSFEQTTPADNIKNDTPASAVRTWIILGVSVFVLLLGFLFVLLFRRRRYPI